MVGHSDGTEYIFVRYPNMPRPENCILAVFNGNKGISLPDAFFAYCERNRTAIGSAVIFDIGYQRRTVLPDQFGFCGDAACIVSDIRVGYAITQMIDERTQRPLMEALEVYATWLVCPFLMALPYTRGSEYVPGAFTT